MIFKNKINNLYHSSKIYDIEKAINNKYKI